MKKFIALFVAFVLAILAAPSASAISVRGDAASPRSAVAVVHAGGGVEASRNGWEARPALSLSKLYLGYWVLYHGAPRHKALVEEMVRTSNDGIAGTLDAAYPQAIDAIARDFKLSATQRRGNWGVASTSAVDVARFVQAIRHDPVAAPLLRGMAHAAPVAADGFPQNYGTSRLPGVQGTKFGWADDRRSSTATVSYGNGFTVAVLTYGDAHANTVDAQRGVDTSVLPGPSGGRRVVDLLPPQTPPEIKGVIPKHWEVPAGSSVPW